jgi:hypothetical protein
MRSPIVEKVAESMVALRNGDAAWAALEEREKDSYRDRVQETLIAAMLAGFAIQDLAARPVPEAFSCIPSDVIDLRAYEALREEKARRRGRSNG